MDKHTKDLIISALMLIKQCLHYHKNSSKDHPEFGSTSFQYVHQYSRLEKAGNCQTSESLSRYLGTKSDLKLKFQKADKNKQTATEKHILILIYKVFHETSGFNVDDSFSETR